MKTPTDHHPCSANFLLVSQPAMPKSSKRSRDAHTTSTRDSVSAAFVSVGLPSSVSHLNHGPRATCLMRTLSLPGLIPVAGDVTDAFLNYYLVLRVCRKADLPPWLVRQMLFNNSVSIAVGFVPLAGTSPSTRTSRCSFHHNFLTF